MTNKTRNRGSPTDREIVGLYWKRDERAIEETDKKYGDMLLGIALNILHDRADSEECRNDAYLAAWNSIPPNRPDPLPAFLTKLVRYRAISRLRESSKKSRVPSSFTVSIDELYDALQSRDSPEAQLFSKELGRLINRYVASLDSRKHFVFISRFYLGNTLESIAKELGVNTSTVQREIEKIKRGLKEFLERNDEDV